MGVGHKGQSDPCVCRCRLGGLAGLGWGVGGRGVRACRCAGQPAGAAERRGQTEDSQIHVCVGGGGSRILGGGGG